MPLYYLQFFVFISIALITMLVLCVRVYCVYMPVYLFIGCVYCLLSFPVLPHTLSHTHECEGKDIVVINYIFGSLNSDWQGGKAQ